MFDFSGFFKAAEADVIKVIVKIQHDIEVIDSEISQAFSWLEGHAGEIAQAVNVVGAAVGTLAAAGMGVPPGVAEAVKDANVAVAGLNALVANQTKGTPEALVQGYIATKQAWAAADKATLALVTPVAPAGQ